MFEAGSKNQKLKMEFSGLRLSEYLRGCWEVEFGIQHKDDVMFFCHHKQSTKRCGPCFTFK